MSSDWQNRHRDTQYVENDLVRAGVSTAFGGTLFALHRVDRNQTDATDWTDATSFS